ncbi:hypothetical protein [Salegentibacter sp. F14]
MKKYLILLTLALGLLSCKNQEDKKEVESQETKQIDDGLTYPDSETTDSASKKSENDSTRPNDNRESPGNINGGKTQNETQASIDFTKYVKIGENDVNCSCFCIDIVSTGQSELCLKDKEIYINARFSQEGATTLVYFTGPSTKNTNEELPWEEFDTQTPIAEITRTAEGIELDWKGFSINGELAVDYAIYGKKTLEGSYRKL